MNSNSNDKWTHAVYKGDKIIGFAREVEPCNCKENCNESFAFIQLNGLEESGEYGNVPSKMLKKLSNVILNVFSD